MDQEQIFNYQLTIQKLEEECQLYRNGTTGIELLELINEKDVEIKALQSEVNNKNDIIQKLALSSQEVLEKSQILQNEKNTLTSERNILQQHVTKYEFDLKQLTCNNEALTTTNSSLKQNLEEMSTELTERFDDISKLQTRCASLVAEKSEKTRALDLEIQTNKKKTSKFEDSIKQLKKKLEINENSLLLQQVTNEKLVKEKEQLQTQYNEYQIMTQDKYELINKQYTQLNQLYTTTDIDLKSKTSELNHTTKVLDELTIQKAELTHTINIISSNKDLQINELMQKVHQYEVTLNELASEKPAPGPEPAVPLIPVVQHQNKHQSKSNTHRNTVSSNNNINNSSSRATYTANNTANTNHNNNHNHETEMDKKIRRQEEYLKKRFLKDKTNSM